MSTAPEGLSAWQDYVDALDSLDEEMRFEYIVDLGKQAAEEDAFPAEARTPEHEMHGCMSKVWILHEVDEDAGGDRHRFRGDSDAIIVKGLVTMMTGSFSGLTADELAGLTLDHVRKLNLGALTTQRQVGMMAMLKHMQKLGRQWQVERAGAAGGEADNRVNAGGSQ